MKQTITLIITALFYINMSAQINPSQTMNGKMIKAVYDKIDMNGGEALNHLMVNPNPHTTANSKVTPNGTIIGTTTYDLQSNAAVQNRIIARGDGTISAAWTMSQLYTSTWLDRGTGYNFYDGTSWGANPTTRLEGSRCGWPSLIQIGNDIEASVAHNTDNSYVQMTQVYGIGTGLGGSVATGPWYEGVVSAPDSVTGAYRDLVWNRSAVGGPGNTTIHMVAVTSPSGLSGTPYNGMDGALLYYRSQSGGDPWDIQDLQLPTLDTAHFTGFGGDSYAIDAHDSIVVIAYFNDWGDSFIMKSTDNGDTWNKTIFLDFPVDKYTMDSGLDLDGDLEMDMVYSTDNSGAVMIDHLTGHAHVFAGNMAYLDEDLADGASSWFPSTNGLLYWNESMGPDNTPPTVHTGDTSLWYSDLMEVIAQAPDRNGDCIVSGIDSSGGYALYYASRASMPNVGQAANGDIYVSFSGYSEDVDDGTQVFRHVYLIKSSDGGATWSNPIDITDGSVIAEECVFASMNQHIDSKIQLIYQKDYAAGLCVRGDEDLVDNNEIMYLEIDPSTLTWDYCIYGCTDVAALNYDPNADCDNGCCEYEITNIEENKTINSIMVYPNPTNKSNTTIHINTKNNTLVDISVVDILGKTIYNDKYHASKGANQYNMNISKFNTGVYFINTEMAGEMISTKLTVLE